MLLAEGDKFGLDPAIEDVLSKTKTLICVVSPPYVASNYCARELHFFEDRARERGDLEVANLSRMTFVVHGDDAELGQVRKQLHKVVTVVKVHDISSEDFVERDLMIVKVKTAPQQRMEISLLVKLYRGRIVDISADTLMIDISGKERKIEAFIELMRPYGIVELARTGRIALVRGQPGSGETEL